VWFYSNVKSASHAVLSDGYSNGVIYREEQNVNELAAAQRVTFTPQLLFIAKIPNAHMSYIEYRVTWR
jgi:hypothetical protein